MRSSKQAVAVVLVALLAVMSMPAMAATNTAVASENTNDTDFNNATTLDEFGVSGTGESASLLYTSGGAYLSSARLHYSLDDNEHPPVDEVAGDTATEGGSPTYVSGLYGSGAFDLVPGDGTYDYFYRDEFDPSANGAYSVHGVVEPDQTSTQDTIIHRDIGVIIRTQEGQMRFYHRDAGGTWNLVAQPSISAGNEYRVGQSWDGSTVTAYLNGSSVGSMSISGMDGSSSQWNFGYNLGANAADKPFDGVVDEIRLWDAALSSSQYSTLNSDPTTKLGSPAGDGIAHYVGQSHTVEDAETGKVNITTNTQATTYVEWQYHDGTSWQTHTNQSYTTTGVKSADLSTQSATEWRAKITVDDSDQNGEVEIQGEWVEFTNTDPSVDNTSAEPTGTLNSDSTTVKINVSDPDFATAQGDTVNASLYLDGSYAGSDTLTSNGTANVSVSISGESNYYWEVTDDYGGSTTSDTFTITAPATLYVFNETSPHDLVDNVNVNVTVTGSADTVDLETVNDGTVKLGGLPTGEAYVFTVTASGYHPREVYVDDLFEQQSVYLLSEDKSSVQNRITITDRTGEYDEGTVIVVDRVINTTVIEETPDNGPQWITMGGDRLGTSGFYAIDLQTDSRYRFRVLNDQGDSRVLGEYTAKSGGIVDLKIGSIQYGAGEGDNSYEWDVTHTNVTDGNHSVTFAYNDHQNITNNVSVDIKTRENGTLISSHEFNDGPYGETVYTAQINNSTWQNKTLVVEWSADRNGTVITGKRLVAGKATQDFPISEMWKSVAYATGVLVLAFLVGAGSGAAPAIITVALFSSFGVYIGLAPPELGFGSTMVVLMMGAIYKLRQTQTV